MKNYVYILTNNDEFEFPLLVADTLYEIANYTGLEFNCLFRACCRNSIISNLFKVYKVDIREPQEKFNDINTYREFCFKNNLKESNFNSLILFKKYCFED